MGLPIQVKTKKGTIRARVYRAKTGKWEDLGVIATNKFLLNMWLKIKSLLRRIYGQKQTRV